MAPFLWCTHLVEASSLQAIVVTSDVILSMLQITPSF